MATLKHYYVILIWYCIIKLAVAGQYGSVIGIDLGTTYSCVGIYQFNRIEIIHNDQGNRITPSYIAFTEEGERLIGDGALNQVTRNPQNTIFDAKRFIGRAYNDPVVQSDIKTFPFKVVDIENKPYVQVNVNGETKQFSAEEISAMVLSKMKRTAEDYLGKKVTHAVVTVPAYFHDAQRQATKDAAAIAGLEVLRVINEPTAAAISYGLDRINQEKTILVYDLGGGTFDVTLFRIEQEKVKVLQTSGDLHLGGQDFDQIVVNYFVALFKKKTGIDISNNSQKRQRLRIQVEKAKRAISNAFQTRIEIDSLADGHDFSELLTRAKFQDLNKDLFLSTLIPIQKVLEDTNTKVEDVDEVLLVGGSTRIPKIQEIVSNFFKGKQLSKGIHPDEAVAHGAAIQAAILNEEYGMSEKLIIDVIPHSIGIETGRESRFEVCIKANTPIPAKETKLFTTLYDNQERVAFPIYEGESPNALENTLIGKFTLDKIQIAKAGIPKFIVNLSINEDGILTVTATDAVTSSSAEITVKYNEHRLSHEELHKYISNEQKMIEMDKKFEYQKRRSEF